MVGSIPAMVLFFTEFTYNTTRLSCTEDADWVSKIFGPFEYRFDRRRHNVLKDTTQLSDVLA